MALFKIFKGLKKNLPTDKYIDGWCYVTTDDGKMYIDTKDNDSSGRIVLNAEKADKLTVSAGSTSQPVYFKDGVPTKINYTIKKSVPSDAVFTDTHNISSNVVNRTASSTADTTSALTNRNVYLNHIDGGAVTSSHKISGSGATSVTADANGNIIISSTNSTYGAAGSGLGLVKSGGDVTITNGVINVNDNSHGHIIGNIKGLQSALGTKSNTGHKHTLTDINGTNAPWKTIDGQGDLRATLMDIDTHIHNLEQFKAPNNHASTSKTYGVGNSTNYGHVKLSSDIDETATITDGIAATPAAIKAVKDKAITGLSISENVITYTKGDGTTGTMTVQDTTYSDATTTKSGLMSAADKTKLNGIATGAEVNQNAFSNITVGSTTIAADTKTDTLTLVAGSNVTLTPDATNDKITIEAVIPEPEKLILNDVEYNGSEEIDIKTHKIFHINIESLQVEENMTEVRDALDSGYDVSFVMSDMDISIRLFPMMSLYDLMFICQGIDVFSDEIDISYAIIDMNGQVTLFSLLNELIDMANSMMESHNADTSSHPDIRYLIEELQSNKVNKVNGKDLSTNDYTNADKAKLATISANAQPNQNAFATITIGETDIAADAESDTLTLVAGSNITLTPDIDNDSITITAKDTTYSNFIKSGSGAKAGLVPAPPSDIAGTTKYLREDGTWSTPTNTTYDLATESTDGLMSAEDYARLKNVQVGANNYTLPAAGTNLGGLKTGGIATISDGQITEISQAEKVTNALTFGEKTYDGSAAKEITAADLGLSSAMKFIGTTTTTIADGNATKTITLTNNKTVTVENGNVVIYGTKEFIWNGSSWEEFGNEGNYKVKQAAKTSPNASGNTTSFIDTISQNEEGVITATKKTIPTASSSANGLMTAAMVTKLEEISDSADSVSFTRNLSSGTKVGTLTINGTNTELYAPTNTDQSVTAVSNHYIPEANIDSAIEIDASSTTEATWGSTSLVTGVNLQRDAAGHVTGMTIDSIKMPANPNTHYKAYLYATGSSGTAHAATTNGNTYLRLIENSTARSSIKVAGAGLTTVSSDASGNITISTLNGTNAGDYNTPVYLNGGTFTECTSLDLNTTGSAAKLAGETTLTSSTIDGFLEGNILKWAPSDGSAVGGNDGVVMSLGWSGTYGAQIWLDDGPSEGGMKIRNRKAFGWNAWRQVLTEHNYNSYSPTLTGAGASGTWGISISGNAATATKLVTAKNIQVNLASTSAASFDGTEAITPGVTGTLAVGNGGTGRTSLLDPVVTWTGGDFAGPTLKIKDSLNKTSSAIAIPSASASASGVVTTGAQTFAGAKTFNSHIHSYGTIRSYNSFQLGAEIWTDGKGGNITIYPPSSTGVQNWNIDAYNGDLRFFCYVNGTAKVGPHIKSSNLGIYGAVWNDYAEFRTQKEVIEPGYCVASADNGQVYKTTEKFQACDGIVSDTAGFFIGETDECKTPLAVAGRVLAYFHGNREDYHSGDTVCAGPEGKVMKMTREEIKEYPDRIIGIVSEIPEYKTWGTGNVEVNNRIWIKVK